MIFQRGGEKAPTSNLRIFVDHCWMVLAHQKQKKDVATAVDISQVLMSSARLAQLLKRFKSFGAMVGAEKKPHMGHISHDGSMVLVYKNKNANIDPINIPQSC
jgi:hypothetical protein